MIAPVQKAPRVFAPLLPRSETRPLTVLSFGGGQDSTALLHLYLNSASFRERYAPGLFEVVQSDTGNEHNATYAHVEDVRAICAEHGIPFTLITPDMGFHSPKWRSLGHFYRTHNTIGSKAFPKTCTDRLKISVVYHFLEARLGELYGFGTGRKKAHYAYAERFGRLRVLIGIAKGEEKRVGDGHKDPVWMQRNVEKVYPLLDLGLDRAGCQSLIRAYGFEPPYPSHCRMCPFKTDKEVLLMETDDPEGFEEWVEREAAKLAANSHLPPHKNLGVFGTKLLPQVLEDAREKYAHLTVEDLREHRMNHGHCVKNAF